jgi:hypothetical protein
MHHGLDAVLRQKILGGSDIGDVATDQLCAAHGLGVPGGEVVEDGNLRPALDEQLHHVRADVARTAGDQRPHSKRSASTGFSLAALRAG